MTRKINRAFGDLVSRARTLESAIAAKVDGKAREIAGAPARQPLELAHAIVDVVEGEIQPSGRGQHAFPFTHVRVILPAATARAKALLEVACDGPPSLRDRIGDRLRAVGISTPPPSVKLTFVAKAREDWPHREFHVEYSRGPADSTAASRGTPQLELTVLSGTAGQESYTFATSFAIGRGADVRDNRHRLLRTNDVAFTEGGGDVNHSVSRRHARVEHDPATGTFRVFDDGSAQGTTIIRKGRGLTVPRGTKGLALQSGDELVLGEARIGVRLG